MRGLGEALCQDKNGILTREELNSMPAGMDDGMKGKTEERDRHRGLGKAKKCWLASSLRCEDDLR